MYQNAPIQPDKPCLHWQSSDISPLHPDRASRRSGVYASYHDELKAGIEPHMEPDSLTKLRTRLQEDLIGTSCTLQLLQSGNASPIDDTTLRGERHRPVIHGIKKEQVIERDRATKYISPKLRPNDLSQHEIRHIPVVKRTSFTRRQSTSAVTTEDNIASESLSCSNYILHHEHSASPRDRRPIVAPDARPSCVPPRQTLDAFDLEILASAALEGQSPLTFQKQDSLELSKQSSQPTTLLYAPSGLHTRPVAVIESSPDLAMRLMRPSLQYQPPQFNPYKIGRYGLSNSRNHIR